MKFKPAWTKEPKAMGLRSAVKPQAGSNVSGIVVVTTKEGEVRTASIRFDERMEEILGMKMPYGVGPEDQAFLKVFWVGWTYEVRGCYLRDKNEVLLWNTPELPKWCKRLRVIPRRQDERYSEQPFERIDNGRDDVRSGQRQDHPL